MRLLASIVAFPVFWGAETWIVWRLAGLVWAIPFALSLPVSGLIAYHYLGGVSRLRDQLRFGTLALTQRHAVRHLLAERRAIIAELDAAKAEFWNQTRGAHQ